MAVVFTTISNKFIAMCSDTSRAGVPKTEKWAPHIAVGMSGNMAQGEFIRSSVHRFVAETGIANFNVENIADLFVQQCSTLAEPVAETIKFIIAGRLAYKKPGAVVIRVSGGRVDTELFAASDMPATLIFEPDDLSVEQCNMLFGKALKNVEGKFLKNPLESIHRRAVINVAEQSNSVNRESDYILLTSFQ